VTEPTRAVPTTDPAPDPAEAAEFPFALIGQIMKRVPYFRKAMISARYQISGDALVAGSMYLALGAANELYRLEHDRDGWPQLEAMIEDDLADYITTRAHLMLGDPDSGDDDTKSGHLG
jgi:hypothetical protein